MSTRAQLSYDEVRSQIATGDVLMFSGRGPISRLIRRGSRSPYSHCGIASREGSRLMVFHAVVRGVHHQPASAAVRRYTGRVDWFTPTPLYREQIDRDGIVREAAQHVGKPFAVLAMLQLTCAMLRNSGYADSDGHLAPAMFCSWYVSQ